MQQTQITVDTDGRGFTNITDQVATFVSQAQVGSGLCHVFIHHTSASLIISENADPTVRVDLEAFMQRLVKDGDPSYQHDVEGPDDMPAHIRSILTQSEIMIPVSDGKLMLGTWQGIYLWEHRYAQHARKITLSFIG